MQDAGGDREDPGSDSVPSLRAGRVWEVVITGVTPSALRAQDGSGGQTLVS